MTRKNSHPKRKTAPSAKAAAQAWQQHCLAAPDPSFSLAAIDPGAKPLSSGDKARDQLHVDQLAQELDDLQNLLYADRRYKMLVVLQGLDTSGKDGTLRVVFGRMSPLGVRGRRPAKPNVPAISCGEFTRKFRRPAKSSHSTAATMRTCSSPSWKA